MAKRWTAEEEELALKLWHEGHGFREIARQVGRPYDSVRTRLFTKHGLTRRDNRRITDEEASLAMQLWRDGLTTKDIAARINHPVSTLQSYMYRHRDKFPYRNDISGADWVPAAIEMRKQGLTLAKIADKCGVNRWAVQRRLAIAGVAKPKNV